MTSRVSTTLENIYYFILIRTRNLRIGIRGPNPLLSHRGQRIFHWELLIFFSIIIITIKPKLYYVNDHIMLKTFPFYNLERFLFLRGIIYVKLSSLHIIIINPVQCWVLELCMDRPKRIWSPPVKAFRMKARVVIIRCLNCILR